MMTDKIERVLAYIEELFYSVRGSKECRVCRERIRCRTEQFLETEGKVKCSQCQRYLEPVRKKINF